MTPQDAAHPVTSALQEIFGELLGISPSHIALQSAFLELGADSLLLMRASQAISDRLSVKVPFRNLLAEYTNIELLSAFVVAQGGQAAKGQGLEETQETREALEPDYDMSAAGAGGAAGSGGTSGAATASDIPSVLRTQLEVMTKQLELLGQSRVSTGPRPVPLRAAPPQPQPQPQLRRWPEPVTTSDATVFIPYAPIRPREAGGLTGSVREHVERLTGELQERTAESKRLAERYRPVHADNRAAAGFQLAWKEIVYPIIADRANGSHFSDVDGNEYIDITMDYGVNLFGHCPPFIATAIAEQLPHGMPIGPYSGMAGPTAALIREQTGVERVAFVNSGTEAVMAALRVARAKTRRPKIALFSGCFHGTYDGILARASTDPNSPPGLAIPLAPGIPASMLEDVIVAPFAEAAAFDVIARQADEVAAVLVEPVQSRRPQIQPGEWLGELRAFTTRIGAMLIFDEIITGFRLHPGGAQAWFGIRADLVTYGKVIGGGMPVGAVAGKAEFMAAIDGGVWSYGDDSWPSAETTFFAGTFWKHPLVMAAAHAVQRHLRDEGSSLQEQLNAKTAGLVSRLNEFFKNEQVPIHVVTFSSLFRFVFHSGVKFVDIFFYNLLLRGIYVWEGRTCYLSTAHTDADVTAVVEAVMDTVKTMRSDGLIPAGGNNNA
jgi:glutamate-1-semialdehyde aminotransferase/acyl carrier protein